MTIRRLPVVATTLFVTGCSLPFLGGGGDKSECDQIAAQAIQTDSATEARDLSAQATECYARLAQ